VCGIMELVYLVTIVWFGARDFNLAFHTLRKNLRDLESRLRQ